MSYASLMLHVRPGPEGAPLLAAAVDLARRLNATLIGVGAEMFPPVVFDTGYAYVEGEIYAALRETLERNLKTAHDAFHVATEGLAEPALWEAGLEQPAPAVARASRAADLIIAAAATGRVDPFREAPPTDLVMTAGRPVLVLASEGEPLAGERVVVAWKDTREARRALADALPLLERAKEVLVLEVCESDDVEAARIRAGDVARALERHGVAARPTACASHGDAGGEILQQARLFGADLIVAGAYGHSRLGEWIFGGVTRALLAQATTHLLLSH
ncbi:universal stress protein [Caulobacter sp. KR2-114]|uniref:universal stress protein n=1 Tax=Caulobacter sp. KR2-114 TaxID=3400912 RepID=UPI003C034413